MEELQVNPALHDIHITFRSLHEVLSQCINYRYMAITEDKHVKIMFSKMQKWEQVANFELYVTMELRAIVGVKEIVQTTTSLQYAVLDDWCTTLGSYTPPIWETPTTIKSKPGNKYEDQFCTHRGESFTLPVVEDEDEDLLIMLPLMVKILTIEMSTKRGLSEATLTGVLMTMKLLTILMLMIWLNVMKMMWVLLLEFSILQIRPLFMNLLSHHFMQILGKIWLILKLFSKHLLLLGKRTWILVQAWFFRIKRLWNMH